MSADDQFGRAGLVWSQAYTLNVVCLSASGFQSFLLTSVATVWVYKRMKFMT